jgi:hypothetical protein
MRKKRILLLILIFLLILGIFTFFGEKGIFNLLRIQKEVARIKENVSRPIDAISRKLLGRSWGWSRRERSFINSMTRKANNTNDNELSE